VELSYRRAGEDQGPERRDPGHPFRHDLATYAHGTALARVRAGSARTEAGGWCEVLAVVR